MTRPLANGVRAHAVPTICPQLQITTVNYRDGFPQFRYPVVVSTSLSKRLYTPAVSERTKNKVSFLNK